MLRTVLITCAVFLVAAYIIIYVIFKDPDTTILHTMLSLHKKNDIVYSDITKSTLLTTAGSSVMGFFRLNDGDRTVKYANSFTPLLYVDNNWYLEITPAPLGRDKVSTRLRVYTNRNGLKEEIIDLPQISKQKWIFIAILRDGRRFDIIYDNEIVGSQRLTNYPVVMGNSLSVGNKGLSGSAIHFMIHKKRMSPNDVERERLKYIDTNNNILESDLTNISIPNLKLLARCPSGLHCDTVTQPPNHNLLKWETPYA